MTPFSVIVPPRGLVLGGLPILRLLPWARQRAVGPFVFLDHVGPAPLPPGGLDVGPHPHIGLATLTWLYEGAIEHRDSVGSRCIVQPGAVNWMTAGRGITHSERAAPKAPAGAASRHPGLGGPAPGSGREGPQLRPPPRPQPPAAGARRPGSHGPGRRGAGRPKPGGLSGGDLDGRGASGSGHRWRAGAGHEGGRARRLCGQRRRLRQWRALARPSAGRAATRSSAAEAGGRGPRLAGGRRPAGWPRLLRWNFVASSRQRSGSGRGRLAGIAGRRLPGQRVFAAPDETEGLPTPEAAAQPARAVASRSPVASGCTRMRGAPAGCGPGRIEDKVVQ